MAEGLKRHKWSVEVRSRDPPLQRWFCSQYLVWRLPLQHLLYKGSRGRRAVQKAVWSGGPLVSLQAEFMPPFSGTPCPLKHGGSGLARRAGNQLVHPLFHGSQLCSCKMEKTLLLRKGGGKIQANRIDFPAGMCSAELGGQMCTVESWGESRSR